MKFFHGFAAHFARYTGPSGLLPVLSSRAEQRYVSLTLAACGIWQWCFLFTGVPPGRGDGPLDIAEVVKR